MTFDEEKKKKRKKGWGQWDFMFKGERNELGGVNFN